MARLDTGWHSDPKLLRLGYAAMGMHAWSISYCDDNRSDGFIPDGAWPSLPGASRAVKALHEAGVWEVTDGGYQLHNYLKYNRSRQQIEADQTNGRDRVTRYRQRYDARSNGVTESVSNGVTLARAGAPGPGPGDAEPYGLLASLPPPTPSQIPTATGPDAPTARAAASQPPNASAAVGLYGPPPERPNELPNGAQQCPLCPEIFTGSYAEHMASDRHKIHDEPADLSNFHP